jgi:hypothetical protein
MDIRSVEPPPFDVLIASICYLISRYALNRDPALVEAIAQHFAMLPGHPECRSPVLAKLGQRLAQQWQMLAEGVPIRRETCH